MTSGGRRGGGPREVDVGGGGGGGGRFPISSTGAINLRASFLPVKRSTHDLMNVWSLAWQ